MKILKIQMENFASHLNTTIDLTDILSATVSGKNGSGKSTAFVDAPLWCLFGKCRSDADAMMAHDQLRMSVTLDFSLDGQVYRVTRTRSKATKAGKTELSFMAVNHGVFVPIGGHKISETQEAIKNVLNADYELCTNSNFLVQGHSDQFSMATPAERKAILAQVLRLDEYALLKTAANKKVLITGEKLQALYSQVEPLSQQVNGLQDLRRVIQGAEITLQKNSGDQISLGSELKVHHELKGKKQAALNEILKAKEGLVPLYKERDELMAKMDGYKKDLEHFEKILGLRADIERHAKVFEDASQTMSLEKNKEVGIMTTIIDLENELRIKMDIKAKEEQTLSRVQTELSSLEHRKEMIESQKQVEVEKIGSTISQDIQKGKLLEVVPCWDELQKKCQFTIDAVQAMQGLQNKKDQMATLQQRDFVKEQLPNYVEDKTHRQGQLIALKDTGIDNVLEKIREERNLMAVKKGEMVVVLEELDTILRGTETLAKLKPELDVILKAQTSLDEHMTTTDRMLHRVNNQIQTTVLAADEEEGLANWLTESFDAEDRLKERESTLAAAIQSTTERLGSFRQQVQQGEAAQVSLQRLEKELSALNDRNDACKKLVNYYATIPVMIMEGAVPVLESACNTILEKISPSGMRVRLETQKALKSSDKIGETLDILVRDVFGEKPYENYSGGEKFRLDLALRFGLSQLLMHRAGSRMETLIIDEGLGSLDGDGLDLLRECLNKLETDFGLILIISHVEGIQGTFEQEIMVEKDPRGSQVSVL